MSHVDIIIPMYNAGRTVASTVRALQRQELGPDVTADVILVDDGSIDDSTAQVAALDIPAVRLLRHGRNRGRAAARNTGARAATGDYLVFLDADCRIEDSRFIMRHVHALERGYDVSVGVRVVDDRSFLAAFEQDVNRRRAAGAVWAALTSANFAVRRTAFEACGGFDERYRRYGFEDRDLAAKLAQRCCRFLYNREAVVYHEDALTADALLLRMEEAGESGSGIFLRNHPLFYAQLPYSRIDFRFRRYRGLVLYGAYVALRPLLRALVERILRSGSSAFPVKALLFRLATGLAYLAGTRRAWARE